MITNEQARIQAELSDASYGISPVPDEYESVQTNYSLSDANTGFNAEIYRKKDTDEYVVAFTGTQLPAPLRITLKGGGREIVRRLFFCENSLLPIVIPLINFC